MRQVKKVFWFIIALLFLIEAKLLDYTAPFVARLWALLALDRAKTWIARAVEPLNPWLVLIIFIVPLIIVEPFKLVALWFLAEGHVITGVVTFALAEIGGIVVVAFLFEACKPKLLKIQAFAWTYAKLIEAKIWALQQVEPLRARLRVYLRFARRTLARMLPANGRMGRRLALLRRKSTKIA